MWRTTTLPGSTPSMAASSLARPRRGASHGMWGSMSGIAAHSYLRPSPAVSLQRYRCKEPARCGGCQKKRKVVLGAPDGRITPRAGLHLVAKLDKLLGVKATWCAPRDSNSEGGDEY